MDAHFKAVHMNAAHEDFIGNNGIGRYVFIPGSDGRAEAIAAHFDNVVVKKHSRAHNLYMGTLTRHGKTIDVASISSGMGASSMDIVLTELLKLGAKRFLRIGTAGLLQVGRMQAGESVIVTASVRDESTSACYVPLEYPALASFEMVQATCAAAQALNMQKITHRGIVHSKASLHAREFEEGPQKAQNKAYMDVMVRSGVLASEMETSMLFVRASIADAEAQQLGVGAQYRVLAGAICVIVGDRDNFADESIIKKGTELAVDLGIETFFQLAGQESAA